MNISAINILGTLLGMPSGGQKHEIFLCIHRVHKIGICLALINADRFSKWCFNSNLC